MFLRSDRWDATEIWLWLLCTHIFASVPLPLLCVCALVCVRLLRMDAIGLEAVFLFICFRRFCFLRWVSMDSRKTGDSFFGNLICGWTATSSLLLVRHSAHNGTRRRMLGGHRLRQLFWAAFQNPVSAVPNTPNESETFCLDRRTSDDIINIAWISWIPCQHLLIRWNKMLFRWSETLLCWCKTLRMTFLSRFFLDVLSCFLLRSPRQLVDPITLG